ncbi:unnamed protein product [Peronospora farinosa]|uniref:Cytosol aminopeptidase domain-containing protein n=1 Tax=Peronospora farinosa TaxID=134698 RepID=A0AAV0TQ60_9STRA|nr:unnamed protein product [Peronospora farinosa]
MLLNYMDTWFAAGAAQKIDSDKLEVVYQTPLAWEETTLLQHTANAIQLATRLVDAPPNELHSDAFIAEARAVAERTKAAIVVIQGETLHEQGFSGIYGVGKAATHKPVLVCLSHVPEGAEVGLDSMRVDDVLAMYSGKTVEVNNTDAEGSLVLADGVAYAVKHLNPKVIVDMATLMGARSIATGNRIGAVYTNDGSLEELAVKAGKVSGDLVHSMPYAPEFHRLGFTSNIANMKNSVKNRANAQVSCVGQFIANHLGDFEHTGKWLHVDMAFPVFTSDDERSTGFGVAFIQSLLKEIDNAGW